MHHGIEQGLLHDSICSEREPAADDRSIEIHLVIDLDIDGHHGLELKGELLKCCLQIDVLEIWTQHTSSSPHIEAA